MGSAERSLKMLPTCPLLLCRNAFEAAGSGLVVGSEHVGGLWLVVRRRLRGGRRSGPKTQT
eukprot:1146760-Alexandrium_andersonii.AAC.1